MCQDCANVFLNMRLIRQFLKDFNLTEDQALKILFHSIKTKKGRPKNRAELLIYFEINKINSRLKTKSIKRASELFLEKEKFKKLKEKFKLNIRSPKRLQNIFHKVKKMPPAYFKGLASLLYNFENKLSKKVSRK